MDEQADRPVAAEPAEFDPDVLLTLDEAARWAGVGRNTVALWIRDGNIPVHRLVIGKYRHRCIRASDLAAYLRTRPQADPSLIWGQEPAKVKA